jgi:hypothetical protein
MTSSSSLPIQPPIGRRAAFSPQPSHPLHAILTASLSLTRNGWSSVTRRTRHATIVKSPSASVSATTPSSSNSKGQQPSSLLRAHNPQPPLPPGPPPLSSPSPRHPRPRIPTKRPIPQPCRRASRPIPPRQPLLRVSRQNPVTTTRPPSTRRCKGPTQPAPQVRGRLDISRAPQAQSPAKPPVTRSICEVAPPPPIPLCLHFPSLSRGRPSPLIQFLQQR